jgi:hypothetical protein
MTLEHPYGNALTGTIAVSVLDPTVGAYPPPSIVQRDHALPWGSAVIGR